MRALTVEQADDARCAFRHAMAVYALIILFLVVTGVPLWARFRRNAVASRALADNDTHAPTLSPRDRMALTLAYPHELDVEDHAYETAGGFEMIGLTGPERRTYIGDLHVLMHESLLNAIEPHCTARVVRARHRALVLELNGQPLMPTLTSGEGDSDNPLQVRLTGHERESNADHALRLQGQGLESGCLGTVALGFVVFGALIVMLARPTVHPIWFGLGCVPLVWGLLSYGDLSQPEPARQGDRLFRLRGRFVVAESTDEIPGVDATCDFQGNDAMLAIKRLASGTVTGPVFDYHITPPTPLIGNIALRYPTHWLDALRRRPPEHIDVTLTENGDVVRHGALSIYDEWRRFPPVHWLKHALAAVLAWGALAIAIGNETPVVRELTAPDTVGDTSAWLDRLPASLAFATALVIAVYQSARTLIAVARRRERKARLTPWLESR